MNCCEQFRRGVGVGRSIEHRGQAIVGRPPKPEVVASVNTGVVEDDAAKGLGKLPSEKGDGVVAALDVDARTAGINSSAIRLGRFEFGTTLCDHEGIDRKLARFLMNAMLASGGHSWTVIEVGDRTAYLSALDRASIDMNIQPFAEFIAMSVARSTKQDKAKGLSALIALLLSE